MWWNIPMAAPLNLWSMYSPGSFLAIWNRVCWASDWKNHIIWKWFKITLNFHGLKAGAWSWHPYALALIGLKTIHVVGATDAPSTQELQQVDLHRGLHKYKVVFRHAEARMDQSGWMWLFHSQFVSVYGQSAQTVFSAHTCARRRAWTSRHLGTAPPPWTSQWGQIYLYNTESCKRGC